MYLNISDASEFSSKLLFALAGELVDAKIHFNLFQDLSACRSEYFTEFAQSNTFWSFTFQAHLDAALMRLCRAFDMHRSSLNWRTLIFTVKEHLHLFEEEGFRERLKGNPFVDSLAEAYRVPSAATIQKDLDFLDIKKNPSLKKLVIWRDKHFAHRDPSPVRNPKELTDRYPLLYTEIDELLKQGLRIVNEYSSLFVATTHSSGVVGKDDYMSILKAVRESLIRYEERMEKEWQLLAGGPARTS